MQSRNLVLGFVWRLALAYGLLIAPWPGFNEAYGHYFRALGRLVFAEQSGARLLRFEPVPESSRPLLDTRIMLANLAQFDRAGSGPVQYLELDTRGVGWVPTALVVALVLATPVPWRRRGRALLGGLLAVHGLILFSVAVYIWNSSTAMALVTLSPFAKQLVAGLEETLITQMGAGFVAPVLIWVLVTVRRQDLVAWRGGPGT